MPCVCRFIHKNQFARGVCLNQTINMYAVIIYGRKMEKIKGPINIYKYCKSTEIRGINRAVENHALASLIFFLLTFLFLVLPFKHIFCVLNGIYWISTTSISRAL